MNRTNRSRAREVALQLLFQMDANPGVDRPDVERFVHDRLQTDELRDFARTLYNGVRLQQYRIDTAIGRAARNWSLPRMSLSDRNIIRLGAFELLRMPDTPVNVVINEAVELARRFGTGQSPSFVNGVLDRIHRDQSMEEA